MWVNEDRFSVQCLYKYAVHKSFCYGQESGRKWPWHAKLNLFSVGNFMLHGWDHWKCG